MPMTEAMLDEIEAALIRMGDPALIQLRALREAFPGLSFVTVSAGDVDEAAYRSLFNCDLHLLDGSQHCVQLTRDLDSATGVAVARR